MTSGAKRFCRPRKWLEKQWEQAKFAVRGLLLATKEKHFWLGFIPTFCIFGTLLNLLSGGFAAFNLISAAGFPDGLKVIGDAFFQTFGVNRNFLDWLGIFLMALLQGILVGLLVVTIKYSPKRPSKHVSKETVESYESDNSTSVQNSSIVALLAILGSGCPTCGTALLTPVLTAIFGSGVAAAGAVSAAITWLAILLALWTIKRLGYNTYVYVIMEKRRKNEKGN